MKSFKVSSCMFGRASIEASEFRGFGFTILSSIYS